MARHAAGGGLASEDVVARKIEGSRWIMTRVQAALRTETPYEEVFARVQARLRAERPYDGAADDDDYARYLKDLGARTVADPECRAVADPFLAEAIPRFAAEWREKRASSGSDTGTDGSRT